MTGSLHEQLSATIAALGLGVSPERVRIQALALEVHAASTAFASSFPHDAAARASDGFLKSRIEVSDRQAVTVALAKWGQRYTKALEAPAGHGGAALNGVYEVFLESISLSGKVVANPGLRLLVCGLWSTVATEMKRFCAEVQKNCTVTAE